MLSIYKIYKLVLLLGVFNLYNSQYISPLGVPYIENYTITSSQIYPKFWDIKGAPNGMVYAVNENGLNEFDGLNWRNYKGSKGVTRSLVVINDSLIYSGSDVDFGVWRRDELRNFNYTSLYPLSGKKININEEFWHVYHFKNKIVFQSQHNLYVYDTKFLTKLPAPSSYEGSSLTNQQLYLFDKQFGLFVYDGENVISMHPKTLDNLISYQDFNSHKLLFTANKGIFEMKNSEYSPWPNSINEELKKNQIFCVEILPSKYLLIGTILNGLYILNTKGELIQHINKLNGLRNNTILDIEVDRYQNIFLGLNYGISKLNVSWPLSYFIDYSGELGSPSQAILQNNEFFIGTNQGLYFTYWEDMNNPFQVVKFKLIPNSQGQVWCVTSLDNEIFVGHNFGTYLLKNNQLHQIHNEPGTWSISKIDHQTLVTGNYNGLHILKKENSEWKYFTSVPKINGSCNNVWFDTTHQELWVIIAGNEILRLKWNKNFTPIFQQSYTIPGVGLAHSRLFSQQGTIVLQSGISQFQFNRKKNNFEKLPNSLSENIPYLNFQKSVPLQLNSQYTYYPFEEGFVLRNIQQKSNFSNFNLKVEIRKLNAFNNNETKLLFNQEKIPHKLNNIHIGFIVPQIDNALYRYKINSEDWSPWKSNTQIELLNLKEKKYSIQIQAKVENKISAITQVEFTVSAPFVRSWMAYLLYIFILVGAFLGMRYWQNIRLKNQKMLLLKKEQLALREQAQKYDQNQLLLKTKELQEENLKLKQNIKTKNLELTKSSTLIMNKNKVLENIENQLNNLREEMPLLSKNREVNTIKRMVKNNLGNSTDNFLLVFDESNQEFFSRIKQKHPDLSLNNMRLAAYIKAGFTSKEIADITHVLPSSIIMNRSRLRKKLQLSKDQVLYEYLLNF